MPLPADTVKALAATGAMARLTEAIKELDVKTVDGKSVVTIKGTPFTIVPGKARKTSFITASRTEGCVITLSVPWPE